MRQSKITLSKYDNPTLKCPKCGAQMWIARIEPDSPGHDKRTFECPQCDHSVTEIGKYK